MRRIAKSNRSIEIVRQRIAVQNSSAYLCLACRHQKSSFSTSFRTPRADEKVPLTERLRQRIWGTDEPPGLKDPYGDRSVFDQSKKNRTKEPARERRERKPSSSTVISADYQPADTWDGLESVGDYANYWEEEWNSAHQFQGFLPKEVVTDPEEVTAALHRAMVEVFAVKQAGLPLELASQAAPGPDITHDVQIIATTDGTSLVYPGEAFKDALIQSLSTPIHDPEPTESQEDVEADRSEDDPLHGEKAPASINETTEERKPTESEEDVVADRSEEDPLKSESVMTYEELIAKWDPSWLQISVENPDVKFAVIKRTLQLTGAKVPDAAIRSAKTAKALLSHLITPPKPRKLIDALAQQQDLLNLPNVRVYSQRITPIDREKEVGRWKLIEKELRARGLPVTGHD
ncbi:ribosomal subunit 39S-domain-containing protein [Tricladium varicosporioides]|nr:ribosomal subunit 39S-domain-containing protein [Hymenoscyphus varicosporioides]